MPSPIPVVTSFDEGEEAEAPLTSFAEEEEEGEEEREDGEDSA